MLHDDQYIYTQSMPLVYMGCTAWQVLLFPTQDVPLIAARIVAWYAAP